MKGVTNKAIAYFFEHPLKVILIWIFIVLILWVCGCFSDPFLSSFFGEFSAALIIVAIVTLIYPGYEKWLKRPKLLLSFISGETISKSFRIHKSTDGINWEGNLEFVIKNQSSEVAEKYFWHILIPTQLNPTPIETRPSITKLDRWTILAGYEKPPIFPKRHKQFPCKIQIKTDSPGRWNLYYYFNSAYGFSPPEAEFAGLLEGDPIKGIAGNLEKDIKKNRFGKIEIITED